MDAAVDGHLPKPIVAILFNGGPDSARAVLSTIAGSLITATSLTFSLTVVALQLASSQFSPRLLRLFASDRTVHATLATFLGTFTFSLMVPVLAEGSIRRKFESCRSGELFELGSPQVFAQNLA